jgi:hypothetical protein
MHGDVALNTLMPTREEIITNKRAMIREALKEEIPELTEAFNKMTPEQKAVGRLVGMIADLGSKKGAAGIEDAFDWYAVEHNGGEQLSLLHKCLVMFQVAETACDLNEQTYRGIRKILVTMLMQ